MSNPPHRVLRPAVRRVVPVLAGLATLVGMAACAEPAPVVTSGGTVAPSGAATPGGTSSSTSASPSSSATTKAAAWPTAPITVSATITDSALGHKITADKVLRGIPWPAGYDATSQAYELVAVEMTWTPSTTYTAPLRKQDFSIRTGAQFPSRPITLVDAAMAAHGLKVLPDQVASGSSATGWVVFKVEPKGAGNLSLVFTRPKAAVSGSNQVFDAQAFGAVLVGSPVPTS
ncbi:hypothetical protein [Lapillicoccus jejuensis]|uniref:Uncharacterized protein n=1 Tax=Lapillicoccus jejuensis TaxID=402171 RepID=A0A542DWS8_9MICO|nr:hypothetical protein [Lapillicoccus jejuensis]TQJ07525.1 hypothetical protein FB458_0588 [Lapillicoccus jejuensis]